MQGFASGDLSFQDINFTGKYVTLSFFSFSKDANLDWSIYALQHSELHHQLQFLRTPW